MTWELLAVKLALCIISRCLLHCCYYITAHIVTIVIIMVEILLNLNSCLFTGSADRTVKFWDLETFELIGSTGPEVNDCLMV